MNALPKLLVISRVIPQSVHAGSIVLQRLLKDYTAENLLVVGSMPEPGAQLLDCEYQSLKLLWERAHVTRLAKLTRSLRPFGLLPKITVRSLRRRIKSFKADVVLSLAQEQSYFDAAYRYARAEGLPLVLIIHDLPEMFEPVYGWAKAKHLAKNEKIYRYASRLLCVSPAMREHLEKSFGVNADLLYPNRSEDLTPRPATESAALKEPGTLTLGYAGIISHGRAEQLRAMVPAFREVGVKLRIYSSAPTEREIADVVTNCGFAPTAEEAWERVRRECDALILPHTWPEDSTFQLFYQTSFPSKLSEYLALGMPVLLVGPEYAAAVSWGLRNPDAALVVTENDHTAWVEALRLLKESSSLRVALSEQAIVVTKRDFDPVKIREQFLDHLRNSFSNGQNRVDNFEQVTPGKDTFKCRVLGDEL